MENTFVSSEEQRRANRVSSNTTTSYKRTQERIHQPKPDITEASHDWCWLITLRVPPSSQPTHIRAFSQPSPLLMLMLRETNAQNFKNALKKLEAQECFLRIIGGDNQESPVVQDSTTKKSTRPAKTMKKYVARRGCRRSRLKRMTRTGKATMERCPETTTKKTKRDILENAGKQQWRKML